MPAALIPLETRLADGSLLGRVLAWPSQCVYLLRISLFPEGHWCYISYKPLNLNYLFKDSISNKATLMIRASTYKF